MNTAQFISIFNSGGNPLGPFQERVEADGGTVEGLDNMLAKYDASASWQLIPSAVKAGTAYAQVPNTSVGDLTVTRASSGTFTNSAGVVQTAASNVLRTDYRKADGTLSATGRYLLEPQRTNSIRNSSMVGAVAGTPGTGPTNWSLGAAGLTRSISGVGIENGLPYVDIRFQGVASGTSLISYFDNTTAIAASTGQTWSLSTYCKFTSNPNPPVSTSLWQVEWTSGGISVVAVNTQTITPSANLQRFSYTRTLAGGATTASIQPGIQFALVVGQSYDFTIRIAAPQMELGAYATTWVPTTTAAVTRLVDRYSRNDLFTNGLVSAAGGTLILDLRIPFALRDNGNDNISISDATGQNQLFIYGGTSGNTYVFGKFLSGTFSNVYFSVANPANNIKIAIKWNGTSADIFQNGVKVVSATAFTATTSLQILRSNTSGVGSIVQINQMLLVPNPLSDAQCIQLTTL